MVACRVTSGTYQLLSGRSIHDHLAFDRAFRVVAGRRNNYVLLLLVGHLAGDLAGTFRLVLWYAIGTLGVYATRNLMAGLREAGQVTGGPKPFSARDRSAFLSALHETIVRLKRKG